MKDLEPKLGQILTIKNEYSYPWTKFIVCAIDHHNRLTFLKPWLGEVSTYPHFADTSYIQQQANLKVKYIIPTDYLVAYRQLRVRKGKVN